MLGGGDPHKIFSCHSKPYSTLAKTQFLMLSSFCTKINICLRVNTYNNVQSLTNFDDLALAGHTISATPNGTNPDKSQHPLNVIQAEPPSSFSVFFESLLSYREQ